MAVQYVCTVVHIKHWAFSQLNNTWKCSLLALQIFTIFWLHHLTWEKIPGSPRFSVLQVVEGWAVPGNKANKTNPLEMLGTTCALKKNKIFLCVCGCVCKCVHEQPMNHISLKKGKPPQYHASVCVFTTGFVCVYTCLSTYSYSSVTRYIQWYTLQFTAAVELNGSHTNALVCILSAVVMSGQ